mgnify:CR=1 FL=1
MSKKQQIKFYGRPTKEVRNTFVVDDTNFDIELKKLIDHVQQKQGRSVKLATFYDKFREIKNIYTVKDLPYLNSLQDRIWTPTDVYNKELTLDEVSKLKPIVVEMESNQQKKDWRHMRIMMSSSKYSSGPGQRIKFMVIDEVTKKVLGLLELASDSCSMERRDEYIGWSPENRAYRIPMNTGMKPKRELVKNCATVIPAQPLGNLFFGGKLISLMATSKTVRDAHYRRYGSHLLGLTVTSLYGNENGTQYDQLEKYGWEPIGLTSGQTLLYPDDQFYFPWKYYLEDKSLYKKSGSGEKQTNLSTIYRFSGKAVTQFHHNFRRGLYCNLFYKESRELLSSNVNVESVDDLTPNYGYTNDVLVKTWLKRAKRRYKTQFKRNILDSRVLFYKDIVEMTWGQTLKAYDKIRKKINWILIFLTSFIRNRYSFKFRVTSRLLSKSIGWIMMLLSCIYWDSFL